MSTSVIPGAALSRITSTAATNLPIAVTATPTYTVTTANSTVIFNGATATTIGAWTLPDPATSRDKELKLSSNLGIVNFTVTGGTSIQSNGAALTSLRSGQGIEIKSDGATWYETTQDANLNVRVRALPTELTYYVSTTGNDTTGTGLTVGTPFATIQRALNVIAALDGNGLSVTIWVQPGTFAGASFTRDFVGWARVTIGAFTAGEATINSALTLQPATKTPITLQFIDFIPTTPVASGTSVNASTDLTIRQCRFSGGVAGYNHVTIRDGAVRHDTSVSVSGTFASYINAQNSPIYLSGAIDAPSAATFTTFINGTDSPIVQGAAAPTAPTGTFTGSKYNAAYVGVADALIPGTAAGVLTLQPYTDKTRAIAAAQTAALGAAGLVRSTAANTADLLAISTDVTTMLGAADLAAIRTSLGLGTMATQNADNIDVAGGLSSARLRSVYVSPNIFSGTSAIIDANLTEFLGQAESKFNCTYTGMAEGFYLWDASVDTFGSIAAGVTARVEVDFAPYISSLGLSASSFDGAGFFVLTWYPNFTPESLQIQLWKANAWVNATTEPTLPVTSFTNNRTTLLQVFDYGVGKVAFDIKAPAARPAWVCRIEYHLNRPANIVQQAVIRSAGAQVLWGSLRTRNLDNSLSTTIAPGTIQINGGGQLNGIESITTTIASPGASWSFAWAKALVGDLVEIIPKNGSSAAVTGRCSTAGTVLADTSSIANGTSIELRILRTTA